MHSKVYEIYIKTLIPKTYKILPLYEEKNDGLPNYVASLILEIEGVLYYVESSSDKQEVVSIIAILESVYDISLFEDVLVEDMKSEVFKCLSIIKRLIKRTESYN